MSTVFASQVEPRPTNLERAVKLVVAALREIFDEAAYSRFLDRRKLSSSREAYTAFRQEYEAAKARRPRCC